MNSPMQTHRCEFIDANSQNGVMRFRDVGRHMANGELGENPFAKMSKRNLETDDVAF